MKIAIDGRLIGTSTGRYVSKLLEYLQKKDYENEYVVLLNGQDWKPEADNFSAKQVDASRFSLSEQTKLKDILDEINPDLVHFTDFNQPLFYKGKVVTTIHDLTMLEFSNTRPNQPLYNLKYLIKKQILKVFFRLVIRKSTKIITPSEFTAKKIEERFSRSDAVVTYESADRIEGQPEEVKELKDKKFIFYVGNAYPHKNLKILVDAFKRLERNNQDLHLVIAGKKDAFHEDLIEYANEKELNNFIHLGFVSDAQLHWLYENSKAYVFPSLSEGFGLPGLEAMQYELPVVASGKTCLPEIYGDAAHYFIPEDSEDIASAIKEVIQSPDLQEELILASEQQLQKYSWKKMAKETLSVYKGVYEK